LGGIKDYTYQNIIFVHDFVYIFLILVFLIIVGYFVIIFIDYIRNSYKPYFTILIRQLNKKKKYTRESIIRKKKVSLVFKKYALYINDLLNRVHNLKLEVI